MTRNLESMKKAVMQNAGVNIYENYFESCADGAKVLQCFRHPNQDVVCSASKVSISIEQSPKIAVAYSHDGLQEEKVVCPLVWDITQNESVELSCESSCSTLAYHKKYWNIIAGGLQSGEVCLWDVRNPTEPSIVADQTHNGYVSCLRWSHKCNYQMLTGSSNGEVFWWDIRKMNSSQFQIDRFDGGRLGSSPNQSACTSLEFDRIHTKNIRIGTGDGRIIIAHKNEGKIEKLSEIRGHEDPVSTIAQNWSSYKCILTVDGCDIKVWGEDMNTDPIFTVSSIVNEFTCGVWSLTRYSRFCVGKVDGSIQFWDLTFNHAEPYFTLKPSSSRVNDIQTNNYGTLMVSCHNNGDVYALEPVDTIPGTVRDFSIEEMNFGDDDGGEQ
ncbi:hypothetical protein HA402_007106 [Bradysia odoriphaga]|nr:hypothetical protein HA402_007106 [Bradysia odoriphaga]